MLKVEYKLTEAEEAALRKIALKNAPVDEKGRKETPDSSKYIHDRLKDVLQSYVRQCAEDDFAVEVKALREKKGLNT